MVSGVWRPPVPIDGHIFVYGRTGSGKTFKAMSIFQFYFEKGYKAWDVYGGKRKEGSFWAIPSDEKKLWFKYEQAVGKMKERGPKEYNVNLYIPYLKTNLEDVKEVPEMLPRIRTKIFTIYWKSIEPKHIATLSGEVTENQKRVWTELKDQLSDDAGPDEILSWFNRNENTKFQNNPLYYTFIKPLCKQKILQGKDCPYNIDLIAEAKEKDRVFVLNEDYTPLEFRMFLMSYITTKLYDLVNEEKIHHKNIVYFREMNLFMKVQDESAQDAQQKQILRNEVSDVIRYGRSGLHIIGDTQSPSEVKGLVEGQEDLLCINELPGARDREEACDQLRRDKKISKLQIAYIGSMPIEQMVVIGRKDKKVKLLPRVQPPRTMGWKRETGSFRKVWKNKYNSYKNIQDIKKEINNREAQLNFLKRKADEVEKDINEVNIKNKPKEEEFEEKWII
ncbi:MAG: hypothetical protein ACOCV1_01530 [Bacillota bacterium]